MDARAALGVSTARVLQRRFYTVGGPTPVGPSALISGAFRPTGPIISRVVFVSSLPIHGFGKASPRCLRGRSICFSSSPLAPTAFHDVRGVCLILVRWCDALAHMLAPIGKFGGY